MKSLLLWMLIGLLTTASFASAQTLFLDDGTEIEGEIRRTEGRRVTIMSSSGVATYDIMEFDENTRREHFPSWQAQSEPDTSAEQDDVAAASPDSSAHADATDPDASRGIPSYLYTILYVFVYAGFVLGALLCFFGRRWFRQMLALFGVCLGCALGWMLAHHVMGLESLWAVALIISLTAMLLGLIFAASLYLMIFLSGFHVGVLVAYILWLIPVALGVEAGLVLILFSLILGIVGGFKALAYREVVLAIVTAWWGSVLLVYSVFGLCGALMVGQLFSTPDEMLPPVLGLLSLWFIRILLPVAILALTIFGSVFQLRRSE
jgi:hypothetical protein